MVEPAENYARFEISGLEVPLPERWYFHDEGASRLEILIPRSEGPQTIEGRSLEVVIGHLTKYNLRVEGMDPSTAYIEARHAALYDYGYAIRLVNDAFGGVSHEGRFLKFGPINLGNGDETHLHLFYIDPGRDDILVRTRAHEEQHAMSHIPGAITLLEDKIERERGGIALHFDKIKDEELAADCNAVHTLAMRGFALEEIYRDDLKKDPAVAKRFKQAMYIYETGDYSTLGFTTNRINSRIKKILRKK